MLKREFIELLRSQVAILKKKLFGKFEKTTTTTTKIDCDNGTTDIFETLYNI